MEHDDEVDARGLLCPLPVLRARRRLASLPPGAVLRLLTDDPAAVLDVPHFCADAGHDILEHTSLDAAAHAWLIRRGPDR